MNVRFTRGIAYDLEGNIIEVPEGHEMIHGKETRCFVKVDNYSQKFVYTQPYISDEEYEKFRITHEKLSQE